MSVTVQPFTAKCNGVAITSIKKVRSMLCDSTYGVGAGRLYFVLTDTDLYTGRNLGALARWNYNYGNAPGMAYSDPAMVDFDLFYVNAQGGYKVPVVLLTAVLGNKSASGFSSVIVAVPIPFVNAGDAETQYSGYVEAPEYFTGAFTDTATHAIDVVGYVGPLSDGFMAYGWSFGWIMGDSFAMLGKGQNTEAEGGTTSAIITHEPHSSPTLTHWTIESPNLHRYRDGDYRGVQLSSMMLDTEVTSGYTFCRNVLPMRGLMNALDFSNNRYQEMQATRLMAATLSEESWGWRIALKDATLAHFEKPVVIGGEGFSYPYEFLDRIGRSDRGTYDGISIGWGLSGSDTPPGTGADHRIYGGLSVVVYTSYGNIAVYGDGAKNFDVVNNSGERNLRALVCAYNGRQDDPRMDGGASVPFSSAGMAFIIHRAIYFMPSSNSPFVAGAPSFVFSEMPLASQDHSCTRVALIHIPSDKNMTGRLAGWYALALYNSMAGEPVLDVVYSLDGTAWSLVDRTYLKTVALDANPTATAAAGMQYAYAAASVLYASCAMFMATTLIPITVSGVTRLIRVTVRTAHDGSGGIVTSTEDVTSNTLDTLTFMYRPGMNNPLCPNIPVLSEDGTRLTVYGYNVPTPDPVITVASPGSWAANAPEWAHPERVLSAKLAADQITSLQDTEGNWRFVGTRRGVRGTLAFLFEAGPATTVAIEEHVTNYRNTDVSTPYPVAYSTAMHVTMREHGTMVFLRSYDGSVGHVLMSDEFASMGYSYPMVADRGRQYRTSFLPLGFLANDVFVKYASNDPAASGDIYVTDRSGNIRKFAKTNAAPAYSLGGATINVLLNLASIVDQVGGDVPCLINSQAPYVPHLSGSAFVEAGTGPFGTTAINIPSDGYPAGGLFFDYATVGNLFNAAPGYRRVVDVAFSYSTEDSSDMPIISFSFGSGREITAYLNVYYKQVRLESSDSEWSSVSWDYPTMAADTFYRMAVEFVDTRVRLFFNDREVFAYDTGAGSVWPPDSASDPLTGLFIGAQVSGYIASMTTHIAEVVVMEGGTAWPTTRRLMPSGPITTLGYPVPSGYSSVEFPIVSSFFEGKGNLRLSYTSGHWVATYNDIDGSTLRDGTYIAISTDMVTWTVVSSGDSDSPYLSTALKGVHSLATGVERPKVIPNATDSDQSAFYYL